MAHIYNIPTYTDARGALSVVEAQDTVPFEIRRAYFIYDATALPRGGHRHKKNTQALICVSGECEVIVHSAKDCETIYRLDRPERCLFDRLRCS